MAKKALLVGVNRYQVPGADLRGCVNDVTNVRDVLERYFDFPQSKIRTLTDARATQRRMKLEIERLIDGSKKGDVLLLHYSGHGANVPDNERGDRRDETDGMDEILCPTDLDWYDPFRDDWLRERFDAIPAGVNLTVIMDCCHSGSNTRALVSPLSKEPIQRYLPSPWELARAESGRSLRRSKRRRRRSRANVTHVNMPEVLITGCRDDQTSADAWIGGMFQGAMTSCLVRAIKSRRGKLTYRELHREIHKRVRAGRFSQRPQLEGKNRNLDRRFLEPF